MAMVGGSDVGVVLLVEVREVVGGGDAAMVMAVVVLRMVPVM